MAARKKGMAYRPSKSVWLNPYLYKQYAQNGDRGLVKAMSDVLPDAVLSVVFPVQRVFPVLVHHFRYGVH